MSKYFFLLLFLFPSLGGGGGLQAQSNLADEAYKREQIEPGRLDAENWAKITKGVNYTPKKPKEPSNINLPDINLPNWDISPSPTGLEIFAKVLLWGLIAALLIFVALRVLSLGWASNKKVTGSGSYDLENIENNLMESDLDKALREALGQQDYRAAIRLYFLSLIKELAGKERIHWKKDKTNGFYLSELYQTPLYEPFRRIVYAFEYAWFSGRNIEARHYEIIKPEFEQFLRQVRT